MNKLADMVVKHRKAVIAVFLSITAVCVFLQFFVKINYNMVDYLPPEAQSTKAYEIMTAEFDEPMPNINVMIKNISVTEALEYKNKIAAIDGVTNVTWLDDMADIKKPLAMYDKETVEGFYKNGCALFSVTVSKGMEQKAVKDLQQLAGKDNAVGGEAADLATVQAATSSEVLNAMFILVPVILLILALSTKSLLEPVLFIATIGVSVLINMGTNIFFGEVSFMTNSVSPILQLAVSLDYAVFLIHSFADNRKIHPNAAEAMKQAIKESMSTISASALTTLFGFLALVFMNFRIGADLGINLAKGIIVSFITATIFLPALALSICRLLDKTQHKPWMPSFSNVNRVLSKFAIPVVFLVIILIVPAFLGQSHTEFLYGNESADTTSRTGRDNIKIKDVFGRTTVIALLVPKGDPVSEQKLCGDILETEHVTGVMSYTSNVGGAIPSGYLGDDITSQFYGANYARIIAYTNTYSEGAEAFETVRKVQDAAAGYYGDKALTLGQSANLYDMAKVVKTNNTVVNLIAIAAIFIVLLLTYKSALLPFILLLTIETGIWINLSIPYFTGVSINFIGYLVLCTVQLGATVDYAILLTTVYMRKRRTMPKKQAVKEALGDSFRSILVSASTLATAGFVLYGTSTNPAIRDIGLLLGRGTLLSFTMVVCFLPVMLNLFDGAIGKTTFNSNFYKPELSINPDGGSK